jgi:hypothetical protein
MPELPEEFSSATARNFVDIRVASNSDEVPKIGGRGLDDLMAAFRECGAFRVCGRVAN